MLNINLLQEMLAQGYVIRQKHPTEKLWIYNYSTATQYERVWNEITMQCRGLILDENYQIIARPFEKFFNLGEMENQLIPDEPFDVYEKMDGSLGILYWYQGKAFIATRGSFQSEQSVVGNAILQKKYGHLIAQLEQDKTYLFEIIYPSNRIVLNYGNLEDLILLAVIDNATGKDCPLPDIGFSLVKKYNHLQDLQQLEKLEEENKEGFVVRFKSGLRYKIKFAEYVRLHRIITKVSSISIWEYLRTGQTLAEILEHVPDEFYDWIKQEQANLQAQFQGIEAQCQADYKELATRKETAMYFMTCSYPPVLFKMLDKQNYAPEIWKRLKPKFQKPFY